MIFDSHTHIFSSKVIAKVSAKLDLVEELHLDILNARERCSTTALEREAHAAGVDACLLLCIAAANEVRKINSAFQEMAMGKDSFHVACTLHPDSPHNKEELVRFKALGIRAIKLCSFSQDFDSEAMETRRLFHMIQEFNERENTRFFVVIDTFYKADHYFGKPSRHITTPSRLGRLVADHPGIDFVAAHMGGLTAPFDEILKHLPPRENLYLETSNAAHTLREKEFVRLLELHGPGRILFGTDWPWFSHGEEIRRIERLLDLAGYGSTDKARVFGQNIAGLLGLDA